MLLAVQVLSGVMMAIGCFFCLIGGIGLNRFPDFYTRSHAVGVTDTMGAGMILGGLLVYALVPFSLPVVVKLVTVLVFLVVTSPISSHAVARAAWQSGLAPKLVGPPPEDVVLPGQGDKKGGEEEGGEASAPLREDGEHMATVVAEGGERHGPV